MTQQNIHQHPVVSIEITSDDIRVNGEIVRGRTVGADPYAVAVHAVAERVAMPLGRPVRVVATDESSTTSMVVHPDGRSTDVVELEADQAPVEEASILEEMIAGPSAPDPAPQVAESPARASAQPVESKVEISPGEGFLSGAPTPAGGRHSFIQTEIAVAPAMQGWQGFLNRLGFRIGPGPREVSWRDDVNAVSEHWPGPRTIAVANPKGSASKTPTTALLAAVFARYGGAGVLAWDNNETRGSLAWRTQRARHVATVLDLLPEVDSLLSPGAQAAQMSHFTHHQPADKYDVLQSDQDATNQHVMSAEDVDRLHQVTSRYYRMLVMDSGNSERADNWRAMIARADALVVPCTNSTDTPEAGRLMLEALQSRDPHSAQLTQRAVAIVSQRDNTKGAKTSMSNIVKGMQELTAEVVVIPFDPAMKEGVLHFDALRPATQRAWLRAAAAVARQL